MTGKSPRTPMAGGFLLATSIIVGAVIGAIRGEASLGFLIGTGIGIVLALLIWVFNRGA